MTCSKDQVVKLHRINKPRKRSRRGYERYALGNALMTVKEGAKTASLHVYIARQPIRKESRPPSLPFSSLSNLHTKDREHPRVQAVAPRVSSVDQCPNQHGPLGHNPALRYDSPGVNDLEAMLRHDCRVQSVGSGCAASANMHLIAACRAAGACSAFHRLGKREKEDSFAAFYLRPR